MRPPRYDVHRLTFLLAATALAACTDGAIPTNATVAAPATAHATSTPVERASAPATLAWQQTARNQVIAHPLTYSPIVAGRAYALLGVAQYAAAVASDESLGITGGDDASAIGADGGGRAQYESRRGAIGEASRMVLTALFPDSAGPLQAQLDREAIGPNGRIHPQFTRGIVIGHAMGGMMNTWAANDKFGTPWNHMAFTQDAAPPGQWYQLAPPLTVPPTPYGPPAGFQYPAMKPYFMTSPAQFHPAAPPAFGSPAFLHDLQIVRDIAASRTADQIDSANFWNLPAKTPTALGYWDEQAARYIGEYALGDRAAAHVLALTNAAAMDATIGCWEAKYSYLMLRPFQNVPTNSVVFTTPNHPSYPSGHSCVSAAAAKVLASFFPEKKAELDLSVTQAGRSRVLAGIHYPFDISAGQELGRLAGQSALDYDRAYGLLAAVR